VEVAAEDGEGQSTEIGTWEIRIKPKDAFPR
jgi:hypothetical protein